MAKTRMSPKAKIWLRNRAGFTLVEMTVVIALIALSATMVVPSMARWREAEAHRAFPSELRRLFSTAREEAILAKSERTVRWSEAEGAFVVTLVDEETAEEIATARVRVPSGIEVTRLRTAGDEMAPADWLATFYPDGTAEQAGVEFQDEAATWSLNVDENAETSFNDSELFDAQEERWPAGDYEQRV